MKRMQKLPRERNQFVAAALFRKAGEHRKPHKALRKQENQKFYKMENLTWNVQNDSVDSDPVLVRVGTLNKINTPTLSSVNGSALDS